MHQGDSCVGGVLFRIKYKLIVNSKGLGRRARDLILCTVLALRKLMEKC